MGNSLDPRSAFDGGYIFIKTDQPFYYPGNTVTGKIYVRADTVLDVDYIEIKVKGKEKCSWWRQDTYQEGEEMITVDVKEKMFKMILDYRGNCFQFNGDLQPGDYAISFSFVLPNDLPSSCLFMDRNDYAKPKAHCQYSVKATLKTKSWFGKNLQYKQLLTIHEPPVPFVQDQYMVQKTDITEWCCCARGQCQLEVKFNKNVFYSNETAYADVRVDNSACQLPVSCTEFEVKQNLHLRGRGVFTQSFEWESEVLRNDDKTVIPAGSTEKVVKTMTLNMADISHSPPAMRVKRGVPRCPEHMFLLSRLAPACHSTFIHNDYTLNANIKFDGCVCSGQPSISVPLTVIPLMYMDNYQYVGPDGYLPQDLGSFAFDVTYHPFF